MPLAEPAVAYEEPVYTVEKSTESFEIRRYSPYLVAEIALTGGFEDGRNAAFRALFGYISGNNRSQQKLEMTIPVITAPAKESGEAIAMTVPVITQDSEPGGQSMQFVLPARFTLETVPQPLDTRVRIRSQPEQWMAVRRFSGRSSERNFRENETVLRVAIQEAGLSATGAAQFAVYNSPFTLWFLRRNEVMVPMKQP